MKKYISAFLILLTVILSIPSYLTASAQEPTGREYTATGGYNKIGDGNIKTFNSIKQITVTSYAEIKSVYIIFNKKFIGYTVSGSNGSVENKSEFIHSFTDVTRISEKEMTITFTDTAEVSELYVFTTDDTPNWVQKWRSNEKNSDLLLVSTHADDEQLFFAGVLPYYAGEKGYEVQVAYFTNHNDNYIRNHELLNGLWTVGVTRYPEISTIPDAWADNRAAAVNNLKKSGLTENDALSFQVYLLRKYKPLVVVGHDLSGEYGHGQHILNSTTLITAVEQANKEQSFKDTADKYGVWDTPKLYIHLYKENPVIMDWDIPLKAFDNKTAFEMTQQGFLCHTSQQGTWFKRWLFGADGKQSKSTDIVNYSPCKFGLYRTTVGSDVQRNDFFENITTYGEQEKQRLASEEAERLEAERLENEKQQAIKQEEIRKQTEQKQKTVRMTIICVIAATILLLVVIMCIVLKKRKK